MLTVDRSKHCILKYCGEKSSISFSQVYYVVIYLNSTGINIIWWNNTWNTWNRKMFRETEHGNQSHLASNSTNFPEVKTAFGKWKEPESRLKSKEPNGKPIFSHSLFCGIFMITIVWINFYSMVVINPSENKRQCWLPLENCK